MALCAVEVGIGIVGATRKEDGEAVVTCLLTVIACIDDIPQGIVDTQERVGHRRALLRINLIATGLQHLGRRGVHRVGVNHEEAVEEVLDILRDVEVGVDGTGTDVDIIVVFVDKRGTVVGLLVGALSCLHAMRHSGNVETVGAGHEAGKVAVGVVGQTGTGQHRRLANAIVLIRVVRICLSFVGHPTHGFVGTASHTDVVHAGHTRVGHGGIVDGVVVDVLLEIDIRHAGDVALVIALVEPVDVAHRPQVGLEVKAAAAHLALVLCHSAEDDIGIGVLVHLVGLFHGDAAAVAVAGVVLNDAPGDHSPTFEIDGTAIGRGFVVLDDTIVEIAKTGHHGGTAPLAFGKRTRDLSILNEDTVDTSVGIRGDGLLIAVGDPVGMRGGHHVAEQFGLHRAVGSCRGHRPSVLVEDAVGKGHHVISVDSLVTALEDTGEQRPVVERVARLEVLRPSALHHHAARHLQAPHARVVIFISLIDSGARRRIAATRRSAVVLGELHDDMGCGMIVFVASGGVEHLLQLRAADGVVRTVGRGIAFSIAVLRDVVGSHGPLSRRRSRGCRSLIVAELLRCLIRLDLAGTVEFIGTLVDGAVLDAGGTGDVLGDAVGCLQRLTFICTHVDTILSKIRGRIDTVGIIGHLLVAELSG